MATRRVVPVIEWLGGWFGVSTHLDDMLAVPRPWRAVRGVTAVILAFIAALWPDVQEALLRVAVALFSIGAAAWAFNFAFRIAWRARYDRVIHARKLLQEAADFWTARQFDFARTHDAAKAAVEHYKILDFLRAAFAHQVRDAFDACMASEAIKVGGGSPLDTNETKEMMSTYLRELAGRLTAHDIDERFLMPQTFQQYMDTESWPSSTP